MVVFDISGAQCVARFASVLLDANSLSFLFCDPRLMFSDLYFYDLFATLFCFESQRLVMSCFRRSMTIIVA